MTNTKNTKNPNPNALGVGKSMVILAEILRQDEFRSPSALRAEEKAAEAAATAARSATIIARLTAGLTLEEALR